MAEPAQPGPRRQQGGRRRHRRRGRPSSSAPGRARPHRVHRARRVRDRGHVLAVVPAIDGDGRSSSTARRSTPSPAARSATPARITTPTGRGRGARHHLRACPACTATASAVVEGTVEAGQDGHGRASTASGATPSAATTPAPTSSTGRCARCSATHVKQQGSLVGARPAALRLQPLRAGHAPSRSRAIEDLANREILANAPVRHYETTKDEARELGAIAFFGDKYGDIVRVLEAGRALDRAVRRHPRRAARRHRPGEDRVRGLDRRRTCAASRPSPALGPIERLRQRGGSWSPGPPRPLGVPGRRAARGPPRSASELKAPARRGQGAAGARPPAAGPPTSAAGAVDGVVVARVDGLGRDELRDLAVAVRDQPGVRAVVLGGAPEGGGVALVAAVTPGQRPRRRRADRRRGPHRRRRRRARTPTSPWPAGATRRASTRPSTRRGRPPSRRDGPGGTAGTDARRGT